MCLVVLAIGQSAELPLILAGNRDEFHARATLAAAWWPDKPDVLGGRDLQAGGTWLALHRNGRFATVTNYRDAEPVSADLRSRGHLVTEFLEGEQPPLDYLQAIDGSAYAGFNLIVGDARGAAYLSNRGADPRELPAGVYGLSNALLDGPWDKVKRSKRALARLLDHDSVSESRLLELLNDREPGIADESDTNRLSKAVAHALTAPFIVMPEYGTRCSTIVTADKSGAWRMLERRFDAQGEATGDSRFSFAVVPRPRR